MKNFKGVLFLGLLCTLLITSCTAPCPLYGKWRSQTGDTISFDTDGTFSSSINTFEEQPESKYPKISGKYTVVKSSIQVIDDEGAILPAATWSIDGGILILDWPTANGTRRVRFFRLEGK